MKKIPLILAAVLTAGTLLTACGESGKTDSTDTTTTEGTDAITFTSTDLDGNAVDESIFDGYKLTMINIWATYCGPCISEMPDLAEISSDYAEKGFQIVGIPTDLLNNLGEVSDAQLKTAKDIIKQTGADYLHMLPSASVSTAMLGSVMYVPTTIFVDENGKQVGDAYIGSKSKSVWLEIIDSLLDQVS